VCVDITATAAAAAAGIQKYYKIIIKKQPETQIELHFNRHDCRGCDFSGKLFLPRSLAAAICHASRSKYDDAS